MLDMRVDFQDFLENEANTQNEAKEKAKPNQNQLKYGKGKSFDSPE